MTVEPIDWSTFWSKDRRLEEWLLEPLLPRGRSIATFSPAKAGKSLLSLDVAARLATGARVLDQPAGEPASVVYFDLEMTEDDVYERLSDMGYGPETDLSRLHYYLLPDLPSLDTPQGGEVVLGLARLHNADLVIFDTTSRILDGPENEADTLRSLYIYTGLPLKADGRTVWRLDHAGKELSKGQRGTSAKNDDVDLVWELTRQEQGIRLRATHRRQSWIPETLDLVRLNDPLRHERAAQSWPSGAADLAHLLDELDVPLDYGRPKVRQALADAGHKARDTLIAAAITYRRVSGTGLGTGVQPPLGTDDGNRSDASFGNRSRNRREQGVAAPVRVPPSLEREHVPESEHTDRCWCCGATFTAYDADMRPVCEEHRT
jgi:hypothetical protein